LEYKLSSRVIRQANTTVWSCDTNCRNKDIVENVGTDILKMNTMVQLDEKYDKKK